MNKLINYLPFLAASLIISGCADSNQSATTTTQGAATNPALGTTTTTDPSFGGTGLGRTGSGGGLGGGGVQGTGWTLRGIFPGARKLAPRRIEGDRFVSKFLHQTKLQKSEDFQGSNIWRDELFLARGE